MVSSFKVDKLIKAMTAIKAEKYKIFPLNKHNSYSAFCVNVQAQYASQIYSKIKKKENVSKSVNALSSSHSLSSFPFLS